MNKIQVSIETIREQGLLPLFFHQSEEVSCEILKALYKAGTRTIEYTNRGPEALANFMALVKLRNTELPDMQLGVGTLKNAPDAQAFTAAGADYLISPGLVPEVAKVAQEAGLLYIPGCMSTTEIIQAEQLGLSFIKLFPGNILGPAFMQAIKDVFPALHFMPTGGVELNVDNVTAWFAAGVSAVGMGSKLLSKELLQQQDYATLQAKTQEALALVKSIQQPLAR